MRWIHDKIQLKIMIILSLFLLLTGCESSADSANELFVEPMIVYEGIAYTSGYDDSNLIEKLPNGFKEVAKVKGVEGDSSKIPKDGYASEQANEIRGVEKGTVIYANHKVSGYIMTEENGQYVVYSSKDKEDVDYSDFLKGVNVQSQEQTTSAQAISNMIVSEITTKQIQQYEGTETRVLFHNSGKEIKNDFFENTKETNHILLAVSLEYIQGNSYETAYFGTGEMEYDQLLNYIDDAEDELLEMDQVIVQKGDTVKRFYWELKQEDEKDGTLATEVVFHKEKEESFFEQKKGSTWIVQAGSNLKREDGTQIKSQTIRIEADYGTQELKEVGQISQNEETYEIEDYEDEKNGFSIQQQSSFLDQYGEWTFIKGLQEEEQLSANPALCIAHVEGTLEMNIQYETTFLNGKILFLSQERQYNTGKVKIAIPN